MSRAKFEEWARSKGYDLDKWEEEFESFLTVAAHEGWLAGRESMRDEAAAIVANDAYAITFQTLGQYRNASIAAIRSIES